jgi:hypothetical protein
MKVQVRSMQGLSLVATFARITSTPRSCIARGVVRFRFSARLMPSVGRERCRLSPQSLAFTPHAGRRAGTRHVEGQYIDQVGR